MVYVTLTQCLRRSGGRTYHVPNYATRFSYANEKSKLISVTFDEDKGTSRSIVTILMLFLLFATATLSLVAVKASNNSPDISNPEVAAIRPAVREWSERERPAGQVSEQLEELQEVLTTEKAQVDELLHVKQAASPFRWDEPRPGEHCLGFGMREYTALLRDLPVFADWTEACRSTEVKIHGVLIPRPSYCESKWPFGGVVGHWVVDFNEEDCTPHWGKFFDKGCSVQGSHSRRFKSRLWGIKSGEDWMSLCESAPAEVRGSIYKRPKFCDNQGIWGIYGIWDIDDEDC
ncbi:hypothetical protein B0H34DRAFT_241051 [Crassisporium funariophilum]|nr:hypothetical protein B0H34DRAFT_241051 [Crassisporium funariophilum]